MLPPHPLDTLQLPPSAVVFDGGDDRRMTPAPTAPCRNHPLREPDGIQLLEPPTNDDAVFRAVAAQYE